MSVFALVDEQDQIVISSVGLQAGDPCLCIPVTKDAAWDWIRMLQAAVEDGEWDGNLPGNMTVVAGDDQ